MGKTVITIDDRDYNIKHGQAINVLLNRFPERYLKEVPDVKFEGKTKIDLDERKLMVDSLNLTRKLVIDEAKTKAIARKHWNSEQFTSKDGDIGIVIKE